MSGNYYCSVDGCFNKFSDGISFFRCPKDEKRIIDWKSALGFIEGHRYANLTPDECNKRIRVCSLHFNETCFANVARNRIHKNAVPSLSAATLPSENSSDNVILSLNIVDACRQTDIVYEDTKCQKCCESTEKKQTVKCTQITTELSAETPIKLSLKRRMPYLEKETEEEDASFYHSNQPTLYNLAETEVKDEIDDEIEIKYQPMTVSLDQIKEEIDIDDYNSPSVTHQLKKRKTSHQPAYEVIEQTSRTESDTQIHNPMEDVQIDEWNHFGNNIACQLRNLPLERALSCQQKIIEILTQERIDFVMKMKTEDTNTTTED